MAMETGPHTRAPGGDTLRLARIDWKLALIACVMFAMTSAWAAPDQKPTASATPPKAAAKTTNLQLPKIWHSTATNHDFRVEVTPDAFHAEWVNVPPAAAKRGAYIHTECRRADNKWVGSSSISMLFGIPGAPSGKDTKLCSLTVRFEVDSIAPDKIMGHSESLHSFDVNACKVQQTTWGSFTWVPKK